MTAVERFLAYVESGAGMGADVFSPDAVLDATVPGWRFSAYGDAAIRAQLGGWFADPGRFEEIERIAVTGGELVLFTLSWTEHDVPHACHQAHLLRVDRGDRIIHDTAFCGGRWPAGLLAEMEEAARARN